MLCRKPYMLGVLPCGCGQCLPCRINRKRLWVHRLLLESVSHASSCFVTLTYNTDTLPSGSTLIKSDPQKWLKRLRKAVAPTKLRYYLVGEYGDQSFRPHYHAAIFGLDPLVAGGPDGMAGLVQSTWAKGHTYVGDLSPQSASYICGYVTKKMTKSDDPRLNGRLPEYSRMSLRPGIGAPAMEVVATSFGDAHLEYLRTNMDVPNVLQHGKKKMPLGRYLKSILRQNLGYGRKSTDEALQNYYQKMRLMFEDEAMAAKMEKRAIRNYYQINQGRLDSVEKKYKIHQQKRGSI